MIEVGARCGYAASSVEQVTAQAGVVRSTFYAHFRDRDACFLAALDLLADAANEVVSTAVDTGGGPPAPAAARALIEFAEREPAGAKVLLVESLAAGEGGLERRERLRSRVEDALAPSEARQLIGGVFRLLAMRLCRPDPDLTRLRDDIEVWIGSYAVGSPPMPPLAYPGRPPADPVAGPPRTQRQRILRATAAQSCERGYSRVRVADITAAAKVSRKTFYRQFGGKAEAATEANEGLFQAALSACAGAFFGVEEWPERVWSGGSALLGFLAAHPADAHLGFVEPHAIGPEATKHVYDRLQAFTLFLEEGYRQSPQAAGLPRTVSEALSAVMFELVFRELRDRGDLQQLLQALPTLAYITLAPFVGADAAGEFVAEKSRMSPSGLREPFSTLRPCTSDGRTENGDESTQR
jgi:AcrR family transcriptional regulator